MEVNNNIIDINDSVFNVVEKNPEILPLLVELGFKPLNNPQMLNTIGRMTSIGKGSKLIKQPLDTIVQELKWNGYEVKGYKEGETE